MRTEPSRQVHLDFHTSEHLPDIGAVFSKEQFKEALTVGRVNQINVFAKCHHGWSYYPTSVGTPHPNLAIDLLGAQIEACHEMRVAAPIYYTGGWSAHDAEEHPQWCMRTPDGDFVTHDWPDYARPDDPKPLGQWKELCVTGGYHELMAEQTEEICTRYPVDGFFYDIYRAHQLCYCDHCRAGMARDGIDIDDVRQVEAYRARSIRSHTEALAGLIHSHHPQASIYFNGLTTIAAPQNFRYDLHKVNTKHDLEDLPTTWGGYDKFPLRAKIFHREQKPVVAMSGTFHTSWGEFGGFKDPEAMRFEAASMISYGASCNFGDHLHPLGRMDMTTYRNVGHAFEYVERIESYGLGGLPAASLGVWPSYETEADEGLTRMLLEEQIDFDVAGPGDDLSRFETIVVPSHTGLLSGAENQIEDFRAAGGSLVLVGGGTLNEHGTETAVACGGRFVSRPAGDVDYTLIGDPLRDASDASDRATPLHRPAVLPETPFLNYSVSLEFEADAGSQILATVEEPYFNRTYGRYSGHRHTPNRPGVVARPAAWRNGNVVVVAHALDRMYYHYGAKVHRDFFAQALRLVHRAPMVEASLPSAGRVSLLHQPEHNRYVAHLLYGPPIERGRCLVIEDLPPLYEVTVRVRVPEHVRSLRLIPDEIELPIREIASGSGSAGGTASGRRVVATTVPRFAAHCAVVAEY